MVSKTELVPLLMELKIQSSQVTRKQSKCWVLERMNTTCLPFFGESPLSHPSGPGEAITTM